MREMWGKCGKKLENVENVGKCGKSGEKWGKLGEQAENVEQKLPPWVRYSVWTLRPLSEGRKQIRRHLVVSSVWEQRYTPYPLGGPIWTLSLGLTLH